MNGCSFFGVGCLTWWWSKLVIFHFLHQSPHLEENGTILTDMFTCVAQWFVCFVSFLRRDVSFFQKSRHYEKTLHFVFTERNPVLPEIFFSRQMEPMEPKNGDVGRWCSFSKEWFGGSSRQFSGECQRKIPKMMPFEASINWTKKAFLQASPLHFSQGQGLISWYLIGFFPLS